MLKKKKIKTTKITSVLRTGVDQWAEGDLTCEGVCRLPK